MEERKKFNMEKKNEDEGKNRGREKQNERRKKARSDEEKRCLLQMRKGQIEKKSPIWKG